MKQVRGLRIIQAVCVAFVLVLFLIVHIFPPASGQAAMTPFKWIIVGAALFCAVDGFYLSNKILRGPRNPRLASKSTPLSRWKAAKVIRMAFALSVSLWGLLLHFEGGPDSIANSLIALGLVLLLTWTPGNIPANESTNQAAVSSN